MKTKKKNPLSGYQVLLEFDLIKPEDQALLESFRSFSGRVAPGHVLIALPRETLDRIESHADWREWSLRDVHRLPRLAEIIYNRDAYRKYEDGFELIEKGNPISLHQRGLETWKRDRHGNATGEPPIGKGVSKLIRIFRDIRLLIPKLNRSGKPTYRAGVESQKYTVDPAVYKSAMVLIQVPFKGALPHEQIIGPICASDPVAAHIIKNTGQIEIDWVGLFKWLPTQWTPETGPAIRMEVAKLLKIAAGRYSYSASDFGRQTHPFASIQAGIRSFLKFKDAGPLSEIDITSSHSTWLYAWLKDLLRLAPSEHPHPADIWDNFFRGEGPQLGKSLWKAMELPVPQYNGMTAEDSENSRRAVREVALRLWGRDDHYRFRLHAELALFKATILQPGGLPGQIQRYLSQTHGMDTEREAERGKVKIALLAFYSGPNYKETRSGEIKLLTTPIFQYFRRNFPFLLELIVLFKHGVEDFPARLPRETYVKDRHRVFARLCMHIESEVVLRRIFKVLAELRIPLLPVHDALVFPTASLDVVMVAVQAALRKLGVEEHFKVTKVDPQNPRPFGPKPQIGVLGKPINEDPTLTPWKGDIPRKRLGLGDYRKK